jgi:hypothetical protein
LDEAGYVESERMRRDHDAHIQSFFEQRPDADPAAKEQPENDDRPPDFSNVRKFPKLQQPRS